MQDGKEEPTVSNVEYDEETGEVLEAPESRPSTPASEAATPTPRDIPSITARGKKKNWWGLVLLAIGGVIFGSSMIGGNDLKQSVEQQVSDAGGRIKDFSDSWDAERTSNQEADGTTAREQNTENKERNNTTAPTNNSQQDFNSNPHGATASGPSAYDLKRMQLEALYSTPEALAGGGGRSSSSSMGGKSSGYQQPTPRNPYNVEQLTNSLMSSLKPGQGGAIDERNSHERFMDRTKNKRVEVVKPTRVENLAYMLLQGKSIPCVLNTAVNSELPGQLRCTVTHDVYGARGRIPLVPKGSTCYGEYNSGVLRGQARVFAAWSRILTPEGVDIPIGSPGADNLGRAGYDGHVDRHFWTRFGNATLLSLLGATAANAGSTGQLPNASSAYREAISASFQMSSARALEQNMDIADTIHKDQGDTVMIFVARDVDFSHVYSNRYARR